MQLQFSLLTLLRMTETLYLNIGKDKWINPEWSHFSSERKIQIEIVMIDSKDFFDKPIDWSNPDEASAAEKIIDLVLLLFKSFGFSDPKHINPNQSPTGNSILIFDIPEHIEFDDKF